MNKAELVETISDKIGLAKKDIGLVVDVTINAISNTLENGEKVALVGFGTFQVMNRKVRRGRNPQTEEELQIPAKKVPKFVPGKGLREKVGGGR